MRSWIMCTPATSTTLCQTGCSPAMEMLPQAGLHTTPTGNHHPGMPLLEANPVFAIHSWKAHTRHKLIRTKAYNCHMASMWYCQALNKHAAGLGSQAAMNLPWIWDIMKHPSLIPTQIWSTHLLLLQNLQMKLNEVLTQSARCLVIQQGLPFSSEGRHGSQRKTMTYTWNYLLTSTWSTKCKRELMVSFSLSRQAALVQELMETHAGYSISISNIRGDD